MCTVKRILFSMSGLLLLAIIYFGRSAYLEFHKTSQLPGLPDDYLKSPVPDKCQVGQGDRADVRFEKIFGANCEELRRPYRLWLPERGILLALGAFAIDNDGRVRFTHCSTAIYHDTLPGEAPEVTTIRCDVALLTLDRPVSEIRELANRKVVNVEMQGKTSGVHVVHHRDSADKSDAVDLLVLNASLWYVGEGHRLTTDGIVRLTDSQTNPPMTISGKGMEMTFIAVNSMINQLDRLTIRQGVEMHVWVDPQTDFLTSPQPNHPVPGEPAHMHIRTPGMFIYDFNKDSVSFEGPTVQPNQQEPGAPEQVHVQRAHKVDGNVMIDQLTCDRLDVQFRGSTAAPFNGQRKGFDKEIESAKAIARAPHEIVLALNSEGLAAYGQSLFFHSENAATPPQTIFKGEPLVWCKGGYKINCRELHLAGGDVVQIVK